MFAAASSLVGDRRVRRWRRRPATLLVAPNAFGMAPADLVAARAAARAILRDAEIDIVWRDCVSVDRTDSSLSCDERVRADETVVRIVPSGRQAYADSLGFSIVDGQKTGCLVTIFGDRIALMAARAHVETGLLLGRAIAHEIGHLLLGGHSQPLMRACCMTTSCAVIEGGLMPSVAKPDRCLRANRSRMGGGGRGACAWVPGCRGWECDLVPGCVGCEVPGSRCLLRHVSASSRAGRRQHCRGIASLTLRLARGERAGQARAERPALVLSLSKDERGHD